jgi:hypothetical protein
VLADRIFPLEKREIFIFLNILFTLKYHYDTLNLLFFSERTGPIDPEKIQRDRLALTMLTNKVAK